MTASNENKLKKYSLVPVLKKAGLIFRLFIGIILIIPVFSRANPINISVEANVGNNNEKIFALDLIGNGAPSSNVKILNFGNFDKIVAGNFIGSAARYSPFGFVMNTDDSFFNEFSFRVIGSETLLSFDIDFERNGAVGLSFPDVLSFFILDAQSGMPLFHTMDPTGSDAIFSLSIYGGLDRYSKYLDVYSEIIKISDYSDYIELSEPSVLHLFFWVVMAFFLMKIRDGKSLNRCVRYFRRVFDVNSRTRLIKKAFVVIIFISAMPQALAYESMEGKISVLKGGFLFNRITETYDSIIKISNISNKVVLGPIMIKVKMDATPDVEIYNAFEIDEEGSFVFIPKLVNGVLNPGESKEIVVKFINNERHRFDYHINVFGNVLDDKNYSMVHATAHEFSGDEEHPIGQMVVEAGIKILVNGTVRAVTDSEGNAYFKLYAGENEISVERSATEAGSSLLSLNKDVMNEVRVVLDSGKEIYGNANLLIDRVSRGMLNEDFSSFNMRIINASGDVVKLKQIDSVTFFYDGATSGNVANFFQVFGDGTVRPFNVSDVRNLLNNRIGEVSLELVGSDENNIAYFEQISFAIRSNVEKNQFKNMNFELIKNETKIPVVKIYNKKIMFGNGLLKNDDGKNAASQPDKYSALKSSYDSDSGDGLEGYAIGVLPNEIVPYSMLFTPQACSDVISASPAREVKIRLDGCDVLEYIDNIPQKRKAVMVVPKGTKKITFAYAVRAFAIGNEPKSNYGYNNLFDFHITYFNNIGEEALYCEWSDDTVWGLSLRADDALLFAIERNIKSQVSMEPLLVLVGDELQTGTVKNIINIAEIAKDKDVVFELQLYYRRNTSTISKCLIAWSPTLVAGLKIENGLIINSVVTAKDDWQSKNDGSYYSIPSENKVNYFHKNFIVNYYKPEDSTVQSVKVNILDAGQDALVLDDQLGSENFVGENKIKVVGTFKKNKSTIPAIPPPSKSVRYRFTISGLNSEGDVISDEKIVSAKTPLWHAPRNIVRFGTRDEGGDDWSSKETYEWIVNNGSLLTAINDISGEHGKDLKHKTHSKGTDIDMYSFYTFPGADRNNGMSNYNILVANILNIKKLNSNLPASRAEGDVAVEQLKAWVIATRSGIDALAALPNVLQVGYIKDGPSPVIGISGVSWGATLIRSGKITVGGAEYDLGTGSWENSKYFPWPAHHDHVHITLGFGQ